MRRSKILLALALANSTLLAACSANLVSRPLPVDPANKVDPDALAYALPQTVVKVEFPVKVVKKSEGKYAKFLDLFFPTLKAQSRSTKVTVGKPTFDTYGEPDPTQVYTVRAKGDGALEQNLTLAFSESGAITGLKGEVTNTTDEIITSTIGSVLSVLSKTYGDARVSADLDCTGRVCDFERFLEHSELIQNFRWLQPSRRSDLLAIFDADTYGDPKFGDYKLLVRARRAYEIYRTLASGRITALQLLAGEAGAEHMLEKANTERKRILAEFTGGSDSLSWTAKFDIVPDACPNRAVPCGAWTSPVLMEFVVNKGLCGPILLPGVSKPDPRMMASPADCAGTRTAVKVNLAVEPANQVVHRHAANFTKPTAGAFFYIVPIRMTADLRTVTGTAHPDVLGEVSLLIAQRGIVTALPVDVGGKTVTHDLTLYDATGALKSYNLVSKPALTKGTIDSLGTSASSFIEAREKQKKAEAEAADELTQLKRRYDLLDLEVKIRAHCTTLGIPEEECGV